MDAMLSVPRPRRGALSRRADDGVRRLWRCRLLAWQRARGLHALLWLGPAAGRDLPWLQRRRRAGWARPRLLPSMQRQRDAAEWHKQTHGGAVQVLRRFGLAQGQGLDDLRCVQGRPRWFHEHSDGRTGGVRRLPGSQHPRRYELERMFDVFGQRRVHHGEWLSDWMPAVQQHGHASWRMESMHQVRRPRLLPCGGRDAPEMRRVFGQGLATGKTVDPLRSLSLRGPRHARLQSVCRQGGAGRRWVDAVLPVPRPRLD